MDKIINIDNTSHTPKYQQIINAVLEAIQACKLKKGDKIPSLNYFKKEFNLSQDTVLTAYNELKARGIISSSVGKGYYIATNGYRLKHKVFVLFDNLTAYKEMLYAALKDALGQKGNLDIYFHHANAELFDKLIESAVGNYTSYIIMPLEQKSQFRWMDQLPQKQVYLLDRGRSLAANNYAGVFQDFEKDTFQALRQGLHLIKKYQRFVIVTNDHRHHLKEIVAGCSKFCQEVGLEFSHLKKAAQVEAQSGDILLAISDLDLVCLVQQVDQAKLKIGKQVGIISYNDTPLKQIAAGGITTISTDFVSMGKNMAAMILSKKRQRIDNPAGLIIRNSL
ncbi:MAG: GntR family transcriptional regulator [Candidatus Cyclobacteriaceae bacterium M3_2C_046]